MNHIARTTQWRHPGGVEGEERGAQPDERGQPPGTGQEQEEMPCNSRHHISMDENRSAASQRDSVSDTSSVIEHLHNLSIEGRSR